MTQQSERPFDATVPFRRREALAAGITDAELWGPRYRRLFHGVFVCSTTVPTARLRTRAALAAHCDEAWASHVSAARVVGAPVPTIGTEHVSVPRQSMRRHLQGIRCHVGDPKEIRVVDGLRISGPTRMFVELAGQLSLVDLVVVGDWLVRRADGQVIRKYDLSYGSVKVAVEYNGTVHVETPEQWEHDLERRADMDEEEWRIHFPGHEDVA